ncbi:MAG: hypothetical protein QF638_09335, partial [Acidimicrobiales bacterium]|nr:hypothetical protein [Acidimicrobiales bacterium]
MSIDGHDDEERSPHHDGRRGQESRDMDQQSKDLGEMLAALQDDVELMKTEIRQTLVDLREFFVKDRTISAQTLRGPRSNGAPLDPYPLSPAVPTSDSNRHPETSLWDSRSEARGNERVDTIMLGD